MRLLTSAVALFAATSAFASPALVGHDFSHNASNGMPAQELALVVYYDGGGQAEMGFEVSCPTGREWVLPGLVSAGMSTFTYDLQDCDLTGRVGVRGATPNGAVDGVAFGMFWKDATGASHVLKSNQSKPGQHVLGTWPTGFASDSAWLVANAPDIASGTEILRTLVPGAVLLDNGLHRFDIY